VAANTQLQTVNRLESSKRRMQMLARARLTNRQAAYPALQLAKLVDQSSNAAGSMGQGQLGLGTDNTEGEKSMTTRTARQQRIGRPATLGACG